MQIFDTAVSLLHIPYNENTVSVQAQTSQQEKEQNV
jgi:hypothetical protein